MPTPNYMIGIQGDECQCGRRNSRRHCLVCGSTRIYARQRRLHLHLDGVERYVDIQFRCQACGHVFIEQEREFCEAPPVGAALLKQKLRAVAEAQQREEYLRPIDQKLANAMTDLQSPETSPENKEVAAKLVSSGLRMEWARKKLAGRAPTKTVDEYVERRLAGEIFE